MKRAFLLLSALLPPIATVTQAQTGGDDPFPPRAVIIGVDGLSAGAVRQADCPHLRSLMRRGSWTLKARGVMPTLSCPNWASILTGAGPEQHGVTSNGWFKKKVQFEPLCGKPGGPYPTIFSWLRRERPAARMAVFHEWEGLARLIDPAEPDLVEHHRGAAATMHAALTYWQAERPDLMFIHLDNVDHTGHLRGWNSAAYRRAVQEADRLIGEFAAMLEGSGWLDRTLIVVTSDHGGAGHMHGRNSMAEIEVPWIAAGPGVVPGQEMNSLVSTTDTAPTVAWALGLPQPECMVSRPVVAAFGEARVQQARRRNPPADAVGAGSASESAPAGLEQRRD